MMLTQGHCDVMACRMMRSYDDSNNNNNQKKLTNMDYHRVKEFCETLTFRRMQALANMLNAIDL